MAVPEELLSGDHEAIRKWRLVAAVKQTLAKRPELLAAVSFTVEEKKVLVAAGIWRDVDMAGKSGPAT